MLVKQRLLKLFNHTGVLISKFYMYMIAKQHKGKTLVRNLKFKFFTRSFKMTVINLTLNLDKRSK